jgi:hypothetical protein
MRKLVQNDDWKCTMGTSEIDRRALILPGLEVDNFCTVVEESVAEIHDVFLGQKGSEIIPLAKVRVVVTNDLEAVIAVVGV